MKYLLTLLLSVVLLQTASAAAPRDAEGRINRRQQEGPLAIRISYPWCNWLTFTEGAHKRSSNVGGGIYSLGLEYYYNPRHYINITEGVTWDLFSPIPPIPNFSVLDKYHLAAFGIVTHNHVLREGRFSVGYGLTWGGEFWGNWESGDYYDGEGHYHPSNDHGGGLSWGFAATGYWYSRRQFFAGVVYRPTLWRYNADSNRPHFQYQHTLSVDLGWRFKFWK